MLSWPDFDIMSFGCSYSMNMYLYILGLAFFTAGLFLAQDINIQLVEGSYCSYFFGLHPLDQKPVTKNPRATLTNTCKSLYECKILLSTV